MPSLDKISQVSLEIKKHQCTFAILQLSPII